MRARVIILSLTAASLLAACGGSAGEAPGLVGTPAPASSTAEVTPETETTATETPSETPTPIATPKAAVTPTPTKKAAPAPAPTKTKAAVTTDRDYGTCKAAKAAGKGPYYEGKDPEYDWYRDADNDGIVCE